MSDFEHSLPKIVDFVRERLPQAVEKWPAERLADWLRWYWQRGWLAVLTDRGEIIGIGAARPVFRGQESSDYECAVDGDTAWVDIAIATRRDVVSALWSVLLARIGQRKFFGYFRATRDGKPHLYPFEKIGRKILT